MAHTTHTITPHGNHTHTIIFLHGRDSTASEFASEFLESQASDNHTLNEIFPTAKWVFPSSQMRQSARFEQDLSQWFDIWSVETPSERENNQTEGLVESVTQILEIIQEEGRLIPLDRIILGGISQGCATALFAMLCAGVNFCGFIGLCSWLPFRDEICRITLATCNKDLPEVFRSMLDISVESGLLLASTESAVETPVFLSHSQDDDVVPIDNGRNLRIGLETLGFEISWREYEDSGHWVNEPQGVNDMVAFLQWVIES